MLMPNFEELASLRKQKNPLGLGARVKVVSPMQGAYTSPFKGRGLDFSEFREYSAGDDIRAIDWRVTARTGRAHTKIFTEERERSVYVIVDMNGYMEFGTRQTFKSIQAARAAALIAWRASQLRDRTGAILYGQIPGRVRVLTAKRSRRAIWEMLKILCVPGDKSQEVRGEEALTVANKCISTGSSVFIVSDFFEISQDFERQLGRLAKRCDVTLIQVSDPADKNIPPVDEIRFSSGQDQSAVVNTNDLTSAEKYHRLWNASSSALKDVARKLRIKIVDLMTDRDVAVDLFRGLNTRNQRRRL